MGTTKGLVWAGAGFGILVMSLVLATPRPGPGKGLHRPAERAPEPGAVSRAETVEGRRPVPPAILAASPVSFRIPLQEAGVLQFPKDEPQAHLVFPVPPRHRLVVEQVSVRVGLGGDRRATAILTAKVGEAYATHVLPLVPQGRFEGEGNVFAGTHALRAYADGGTHLNVRVDRTAGGEGDSGFVTLSGYLEELR